MISGRKALLIGRMNKTKIPTVAEMEAALVASGQDEALADFRAALARGDKIGALRVARSADVLTDP